MSTPRTLALPTGVEATTVTTERGGFAVHRVRPGQPRAHVLLVPGWTGSKEDFTPVLPSLARAGLAATAYDQRGQFETPAAGGDDLTLSGWAADGAGLAAVLWPGEPSHLLGHSFGGLVAQQAAVEHPTAWRTLSLLCTGPGALGESPVRPLRQVIDALRSGMPMAALHAERQRRSGADDPPDIAAFLERRFTSNSRTALAAMTALLLDAPDTVDEVAATGLPCWVGRGAGDDAWPHDVQQRMAERLGTDVVVLDNADHSPAVEDPDGLAEAWLPFLRAHL